MLCARDHEGDGGGPEDVESRGTGYLTNFSANSEYSSNAFSEASQSLSDGLRVVSNGSGLVKP